MKYKLLGRSGLRVSELCLGAMTFGEELGTGASEAVSRQIYDQYRAAGGNFVDTANIYTMGTSERMLGCARSKSLSAISAQPSRSTSSSRVRATFGSESQSG